MAYRTRTYIAGNWTGDSNLITQLYAWNNSAYWGLHFVDAHELTQARDTSLNCSIKASLRERLDHSNRFVLVVGDETAELRAGSCAYCGNYIASRHSCERHRSIDLRSYVQYECEYAAHHIDKIVVLYNSPIVRRESCPPPLRSLGSHLPAYRRNNDGSQSWCYQEIKRAFER